MHLSNSRNMTKELKSHHVGGFLLLKNAHFIEHASEIQHTDLNPSTISGWIQRSKALAKDDGSHSLVDISEIISSASNDVPKETFKGTITFRMNSFEFEIGLNQLGVFLEEVKNAGRK